MITMKPGVFLHEVELKVTDDMLPGEPLSAWPVTTIRVLDDFFRLDFQAMTIVKSDGGESRPFYIENDSVIRFEPFDLKPPSL